MIAAQPEMLIGAGTVLSVDQAKQAVSAGAKLIVSPENLLGWVHWIEEMTS
jgi:2-dehydro-3-deoxyphosphogluconate aldolase/(4S)-4-hydroxy-2-oxoglutarate aldolase